MANRFYQVNLLSGPTYWEDIGNNLSIVGILLEGESTPTILKLPSCGSSSDKIRRSTIIDMDYEEWSQFLQHSDQPSVLLKDESGTVKAIHRKTRYDVSGAIQQKIWARDGFACMFCQQRMGKVQLTIDHFVPLDKGGANDPSNYISACKKCNKRKGNIDPEDFCIRYGLDYNYFVEYLKNHATV